MEQLRAAQRKIRSRQAKHARNSLAIAQLRQPENSPQGGDDAWSAVPRGRRQRRVAGGCVLKVAAQVEVQLGGGVTARGGTGDRQLRVGEGEAQLERVRPVCK
jgi:hypothetical protein